MVHRVTPVLTLLRHVRFAFGGISSALGRACMGDYPLRCAIPPSTAIQATLVLLPSRAASHDRCHGLPEVHRQGLSRASRAPAICWRNHERRTETPLRSGQMHSCHKIVYRHRDHDRNGRSGHRLVKTPISDGVAEARQPRMYQPASAARPCTADQAKIRAWRPARLGAAVTG